MKIYVGLMILNALNETSRGVFPFCITQDADMAVTTARGAAYSELVDKVVVFEIKEGDSYDPEDFIGQKENERIVLVAKMKEDGTLKEELFGSLSLEGQRIMEEAQHTVSKLPKKSNQ